MICKWNRKKCNFFYQYTTGIVLLSVAVSVSIYRDTYRIALHVSRYVSDDGRIAPALVNSSVVTITVKAPNIAHLSLLTSIGYNKKETKLKKSAQPNKVIIIYYLPRVQNEKKFPNL